MYLTPNLSLQVPEYGDDNIVPPVWMSYFDYTFGQIDTLLYAAGVHKTSTGADHSWLDQSLVKNSSPYFNEINAEQSSGTGYGLLKAWSYSSVWDSSAKLFFYRSRGTKAAKSALVNNDVLYAINVAGYTGSYYASGNCIQARVEGTPSGTTLPMRLLFFTTTTGGSNALALSLNNAQDALFQSRVYSSNLTGGATTLSVDASGYIIRTPSDSRYKDNVRDIDFAEEQLMALRPVSCEWNAKSGMGTGRSTHTFIAQEMETVVPEAVSKGNDGKYSKDDGPIVALLVKHVQNLTKRIEELEKLRGKK